MPAINRIIFTGDVFRTYAGERNQLANVRWLSRHFSPLLTSLTGLPTEIRLAGAEHDTGGLMRSWYDILGSDPCIESWARHFDSVPSLDLIEAVASEYRNALVISIEIPPILQRIMDARKIPWIDIGISPLRFLEDYAICFRMSQHFEGKFPSNMTLSSSEIERSVRRVQETYQSQPAIDLNGAVVFFAQTSQDRTLIKDGRFVGADEAVAGLKQLRGARRVYVKPHPLEPGNPVVAAIVSEFDAEIIDTNTYEILASKADVSVATLSSSVGHESNAFGKRAHVFHPDVQKWAFSGHASLRQAFSADLWSSLLSPMTETRKVCAADRPPWTGPVGMLVH